VSWLEVNVHQEGPATSHLGTSFLGFSSVFRQMLRLFPRTQVATACLLASHAAFPIEIHQNWFPCFEVKD
jgi:hypothetical protein